MSINVVRQKDYILKAMTYWYSIRSFQINDADPSFCRRFYFRFFALFTPYRLNSLTTGEEIYDQFLELVLGIQSVHSKR